MEYTYMKLTEENKRYIDSLSILQLLEAIRFRPSGDPLFDGETGEYWMKKYAQLRSENPEAHTSILIIYELIPDQTKIYKIDVSKITLEELRKIKSAHGVYAN